MVRSSGRPRRAVVGALAGVLAAGGLLAAPGGAQAAGEAPGPAAARSTTLATGERLELVDDGRGGAPGIRVTPAPGTAPGSGPGRYAFASVDGQVRALPGGPAKAPKPSALTADPGAQAAGAATRRSALAASANQKVTFSVANKERDTGALMHVWNLSTWTYYPVDADQFRLQGTASLPPGKYLAMALYSAFTRPSYLLVRGFTVASAPVSVAFDEKAAKPVSLVPDDPTARRAGVTVWAATPGGGLVGFAGGGASPVYVTPFTVTGVSLRVHEKLVKKGSAPTPYVYDLVHNFERSVPAAPSVPVRTADLARTVTSTRSQSTDPYSWLNSSPRFDEDSSGVFAAAPVPSAGSFTEYTTPGRSFSRSLDHSGYSASLPARTLPAGTSPGTTIGSGPLSPAPARFSRTSTNMNLLGGNGFTDADGDVFTESFGHHALKLTSNGATLLDEPAVETHRTRQVPVPTGRAPYALTQTVDRDNAGLGVSTRATREWTFTSAAPAGRSEGLPLVDVDFDATGLDARNRAAAGKVAVSATATTTAKDATAEVTGLEYSLDEGRGWLPVEDGAVPVAATDRHVSLRATARDSAGGTVRTTLMRAFAGPATTPAPDQNTGTVRIGTPSFTVGDNGTAVPPMVVPGDYHDGWLTLNTSFEVTAPAGAAAAHMTLYNGTYENPRAVLDFAFTRCVPKTATTATCTGYTGVSPKRLNDGSLTGFWHAAVRARATDGSGTAFVKDAATVRIMRPTYLTATDATPEPVKKGATLTAKATFTVSDWATGAKVAYPGQKLTLEFRQAGTTAWKPTTQVVTDSAGRATASVKATATGDWRFTSGTTDGTTRAVSAQDNVVVK
ncbi:hypothetical protein ABT160_14990 [Streptomyces sp. NPDC001941]|uniref:hypothetical protein n=1 Tax=Streptomyces sp. NPDC001941 TaxID=3154659 RepID=UPI00331BC3C6